MHRIDAAAWSAWEYLQPIPDSSQYAFVVALIKQASDLIFGTVIQVVDRRRPPAAFRSDVDLRKRHSEGKQDDGGRNERLARLWPTPANAENEYL